MGAPTSAAQGSLQPGWMRSLQTTCERLLKGLPETSVFVAATEGALRSPSTAEAPLDRFYRREIALGRKLLRQVVGDLQSLLGFCRGEIKQTNHIRGLIDTINKGAIPTSWSLYKVEKGMPLVKWVSDLKERLTHLQGIATPMPSSEQAAVWLGGLFRPSGWITASRQQSAHLLGMSLEAIELALDFGQPGQDDGYPLRGLALQGATWSNGTGLKANDGKSEAVSSATLVWRAVQRSAVGSNKQSYDCPIYLNGDRDIVLFTAALPSHEPQNKLIQRGVCMLAHSEI